MMFPSVYHAIPTSRRATDCPVVQSVRGSSVWIKHSGHTLHPGAAVVPVRAEPYSPNILACTYEAVCKKRRIQSDMNTSADNSPYSPQDTSTVQRLVRLSVDNSPASSLLGSSHQRILQKFRQDSLNSLGLPVLVKPLVPAPSRLVRCWVLADDVPGAKAHALDDPASRYSHVGRTW